jgi:bifunctional DNA-binding transcriptional regulator/antitoxin component of YhaV-PrlF toxin-antitoxin module
MTDRNHNPSPTDGHASGSQPGRLADVPQPARAVTRETELATQTRRSVSPGRDLPASSARPRRMQHSSAAPGQPRLRQHTGSARPRGRTSAQGITDATESLASPRAATSPGRPQALSQVLHLIKHTALVYGVARVLANGIIRSRGTVEALHWQHADTLDADLIPGAIILRPSPNGRTGVHHNLRLTIPAAARRSHGIKTGDFVLLAAAPAHNILIIFTMRALDELMRALDEMIAVDARPSGANPAAAADASGIVYPPAARSKL